MNKEPIIESFRRWMEESPERLFNEAEVKIMLDRIDYLEGKADKCICHDGMEQYFTDLVLLKNTVAELEADRDLMIRKFNEDLENAIDFHVEEMAKKRRENKDTGWSGPSW